MDNSVIIKSNKYGLAVILDSEEPYEELLEDIGAKFRESSRFFKNAQMAISFEGRELNEAEEREILDVITSNSEIKILCVVDRNETREQVFQKKLSEQLEELNARDGRFYKGTLRSGQLLEADTSIVILGDVNPGANVISKGNVVVLGALKGTVYAGGGGNENSFVAALYMHPVQIRIGDVIARSPDKAERSEQMNPKIAFVEDGNIYIEPMTKDVLNDIQIL